MSETNDVEYRGYTLSAVQHGPGWQAHIHPGPRLLRHSLITSWLLQKRSACESAGNYRSPPFGLKPAPLHVEHRASSSLTGLRAELTVQGAHDAGQVIDLPSPLLRSETMPPELLAARVDLRLARLRLPATWTAVRRASRGSAAEKLRRARGRGIPAFLKCRTGR